MRKIMILGAGIYQVPLIKKARAMGLETIVVSVPGPYPGFAFADKTYSLDTRDVRGILAAAKEEKIDGIVTTGTDVAVRAIGTVCDAMGLPGISRHAAEILTDKALMKEAFKKGGVHTADFRIIGIGETSGGEKPDASGDKTVPPDVLKKAEAAAEEIGYPVMVKACDVSGSRGITKVEGPEGLEEAVARASGATRADHLIVEKVNEGYEIGLDGFVRGKQPALCLPHTKYVGRSEATTVPVGHGFPFPGSPVLKETIKREFQTIIDACGLDNCAFNADIFVKSDTEVSVIEAGGRAGATTIPELITLHTGIDFYAAMIASALGEACDMTPVKEAPCIGQLLLSPVDGVIRSIDEKALDRLRESGAVIELDYGVGCEVRAMRNGTDRIGQIIMETDDPNRVEEMKAKVLEAIRIEKKPFV